MTLVTAAKQNAARALVRIGRVVPLARDVAPRPVYTSVTRTPLAQW